MAISGSSTQVTIDVRKTTSFPTVPSGVGSTQFTTFSVFTQLETSNEPISTSKMTVESSSTPTPSPQDATSDSTSVASTSTTSSLDATSKSDTMTSTSTTAERISSSSNSTSTSISRSKNSVSPGAAAGIGVGSAVAGALIAALILWLLMRRPQKRARVPPGDSRYLPLPIEKPKGPPAIESSIPQPLDDREVAKEFSTICTLINNHVISYYHTAPPSMKVENVNQAALDVLGQRDAPVIASSLTTWLSDLRTRIPALRFCIAWTVLSRIQPDCESTFSFLPPEIAACLDAMSSASNNQQSKSHMALLSKWRTISALLLQRTYDSDKLPSLTDPRQRNIENALQALNQILDPHADRSRGGGGNQRTKNLAEILKRGARVGYLLFSQPSVWKFDWDNHRPGDNTPMMTIFPALVKVGDENGQTIGKPIVLVDREVVA